MLKRAVLALLLIVAPAQAFALETDDLLALVAMPLAVAAVADLADVPVNELIDVVTMLNAADVPPPQFIEVVRYVPVALVADVDADDDFVQFVRLRLNEGVRGEALVLAIEQRLPEFGLADVDLTPVATAPVVVVDQDFVPVVVRTRVVEAKRHPHGGPPGQLKKQLGVQTGAEVVHGKRRGRDFDDDERGRVRVKQEKREKVKVKVDVPPPMTSGGGPPGRVKVKDDGGGKGHGGPPGHKGGDKGKGKGKGKGD